MGNLIALLIGYGTVLLPQIYEALREYNSQHPSPYLALALSVIGTMVLHGAKSPFK